MDEKNKNQEEIRENDEIDQELVMIGTCKSLIIAFGNFYNFKVGHELAGAYLHILNKTFSYFAIKEFFLKALEEPYAVFDQFPSIKKIRQEMTPNYNAKLMSNEISAEILSIYSEHGPDALDASSWPFHLSFKEWVCDQYSTLCYDVIDKMGGWIEVCKEIEDASRKHPSFSLKSNAPEFFASYSNELSDVITQILKKEIPA